jgi:hypothetical protein
MYRGLALSGVQSNETQLTDAAPTPRTRQIRRPLKTPTSDAAVAGASATAPVAERKAVDIAGFDTPCVARGRASA